MELFLNLAWAVLAAFMWVMWLRFAPHSAKGRPGERRMQMVALAVLILILLPAISITDDLQAAQNPAETDTCIRRDHDLAAPHSILPAVASLPIPVFQSPSAGLFRAPAPGALPSPRVQLPALASIQNRPPPSA